MNATNPSRATYISSLQRIQFLSSAKLAFPVSRIPTAPSISTRARSNGQQNRQRELRWNQRGSTLYRRELHRLRRDGFVDSQLQLYPGRISFPDQDLCQATLRRTYLRTLNKPLPAGTSMQTQSPGMPGSNRHRGEPNSEIGLRTAYSLSDRP